MELSVKVLEGIMLSGTKHSETDVYTSGRGTRLDPVKIESVKTTIHEFWFKCLDGTEKKVKLFNDEVEAREGHRLVLLQGQNADYSGCVGYINVDTGRFCLFDNAWLAKNMASQSKPVYFILATGFVMAIVLGFMNGFIAGLATFAGGMLLAQLAEKVHSFFIDRKLSKLAKETLKSAYKFNSFTQESIEIVSKTPTAITEQ
ncbi:hypothetical protein L2728_19510 [Shewanella chilikensis]|uniref:Uncharacterized protein n=1 Tax=Shewanella chilikensis TaxID=558541 RepID=A0ABX5PHG8_9GAMM|nr:MULTISPECIES: hypothetical protein [Shewanella]MCL1156230.1 hypothetical protein [Shewanella chilikensis]MCL1164034.1 hypothetical protein [Shewanella chilikensis]PYE53447.1 hypothetical protein C8J23_1635 [Shewanella chilikensis]